MTNQTLITKYQDIWNKYANAHFGAVLERGFVFQYDEDEQECELLFLGMNPSFKEGDKSKFQSYQRPNSNDDKLRPYFKSFVTIEKTLQSEYNWKGKWTHLDLFAFRKTNQKYIEKDLLNSSDGIPFLYEQLMIARERILHIKPKVIVMSNALIRMFSGKERIKLENGDELGVWMDFHYAFDKDLGTNVITAPNEIAGTIVFFTSMLSGQRALDNGSRDRLIWHIARGLKMSTSYKSNLPKFYNYAEEYTDNGYESMMDFYTSWLFRCAVSRHNYIHEADKKTHEYSLKIAKTIIYSWVNNEGIIETNTNNDLVIKSVVTKRQLGRIDLIVELDVIENGIDKKMILSIENKWYSSLGHHQLEKNKEQFNKYYSPSANTEVRHILIFADWCKINQAFVKDIYDNHHYQVVTRDEILMNLTTDKKNYKNIPLTGNHLFDSYWINGWEEKK